MIQKITDHVAYVEGDDSQGPGPKIGLLWGTKNALLVDVSNDPSRLQEALDFLQKERGFAGGIVVLTHFHPDHIDALKYLPQGFVIKASKNTIRYVHREAEVVEQDETLDLGGLEVRLFLVPSLHSKGSLDVLADSYLFVGDSLYSRYQGNQLYFNHEVLFEERKKMASIPFAYAIPAHEGPLESKEKVLARLDLSLKQGSMVE
jgi:glyoxylase-like metal-dependent hydrolase (beta-lactamase superfamily II)